MEAFAGRHSAVTTRAFLEAQEVNDAPGAVKHKQKQNNRISPKGERGCMIARARVCCVISQGGWTGRIPDYKASPDINTSNSSNYIQYSTHT